MKMLGCLARRTIGMQSLSSSNDWHREVHRFSLSPYIAIEEAAAQRDEVTCPSNLPKGL